MATLLRGGSIRLVAWLVAALAVRLVFFGGLLGWDDVDYWQAARELRAGHLVPGSSFQLRYTLTVPLALAQACFGEREWVLSLVPLVYSVAHLALAWALGLLVGGVVLATAAVALLALLPLDVIAATDLHADLPLAMFLAATVYAVLRGERATRARAAWFLVAGVALGLGVITKESALALLPALALRRWLGAGRGGLAEYGWLGAGFLGVTAIEMIGLGILTGNPLYRYLGPITGAHAATVRTLPPGHGWMLGYPAMLLNPLDGYFGYFAGVFYVALAATIWGVRRRVPAIAELGVWWGALLVIFNFAPLDASFTRPLFHHFARTLHPLLIPLALAATLWLRDGLAGRWAARACVAGAVTALAVTGIVVTHADYRAWTAVARQAAPFVATLPAEARVVTDRLTAAQLRFLLPGWAGRIEGYAGGPIVAAGAPAFVLSDPAHVRLGLAPGETPPDALARPSASWEPIARFERRQRPSLRGMLAQLLGRHEAASAPPGAAVLWRVGSW